MTIPTAPALSATPPAMSKEDDQALFDGKADLFLAWMELFGGTELPALIAWLELLPAEYVTALTGLGTSGVATITAARDSAVTTVSNTGATQLSNIAAAITTAAENAVAIVNNATIGIDVAMTASGSFNFPASLLAGTKYNLNVAGDLVSNNFTLNMNGHKFAGAVHATVEWDKNVGAELVYINATYGFGVR